MNGTNDLPPIPTLPPIEMPDTATLFSSSDRLPRLDEDYAMPHTSPTTPAQTQSGLSPSAHVHETMDSSSMQSQSLVPPSNLRKSISVDSFVRHSRSGPVAVVGRQGRTNTVGAGSEELRGNPQGTPLPWQPRTGEPPHVSYQERDSRFPLSGRSRGASISTIGDEYPRTLAEDSDDDSNEPIRFGDVRRTAPKGKDKLRPIISPGDLPLPTKLPGLSSPSSVSSLSISSLNLGDDMPRLPVVPTGINHRWTGVPGPSSPARLARSGSFDAFGNNGDGSFLVGLDAQFSVPEVTMAVIGGKGCGKSASISKGLKAYKLSEPVTVTDRIRGNEVFKYTLREGIIGPDLSPDCVLSVLEVDATVLRDRAGSGTYIWPDGAPSLDAVIVCYDVSREDSFVHVESLTRSFRQLKLPIVVFACKCDLPRHVESNPVYQRLARMDVGLVEVTVLDDEGKNQLRLGFDWLLKSIARVRRVHRPDDNQNPASPDVLVSPPPWDISRASSATPTAASAMSQVPSSRYPQHTTSSPTPPRSPHAPTSPTRARSTNDLLASDLERSNARELTREKSRSTVDMRTTVNAGTGPLQIDTGPDGLGIVDESMEERAESSVQESRPVAYATLEELLDKLLFLAVSGDDWGYISHFLLTYRRFASPRSVVLAMQKRMRQLDQSSTDPMFACFAQMRICHLLEVWIQDYPHDFAVGAAADALNALVKSIVSKTHLLHYGSDFLPFLESRPLEDRDAAWALKVEESADESDDSYSLSEDEDEDAASEGPPAIIPARPPANGRRSSAGIPLSARERKSSLPLTAKALVMPEITDLRSEISDELDSSPKHVLKALAQAYRDLDVLSPNDIAEEITRIETKLFLEIEPRHWLVHTLVSGRKDPEVDSIARFSELSNHLADWVVSLILYHDRPKARARQIEKLVEVADKLRFLNNYSALRAFVAGINNASYPGDPAMTEFQKKSPILYKHLQSWDLLLQSARSHRSYRMALRNTKGACIPALEVHLSDLIRAHEGNDDFSMSDPRKIHWAKFNMMGKFIQQTTHFQAQCRATSAYVFPERKIIRDLLLLVPVMDPEMQRSRITPPSEAEATDIERSHLPRTMTREYPERTRDSALFRKLFFWV